MVSFIRLSLGTVRLSLNQVITGLGIPKASQLKFAFFPVAILSREIGLITNLGFEGTTRKVTDSESQRLVIRENGDPRKIRLSGNKDLIY